MEQKNNISKIPQYSLAKTLLVWAAAAIPMAILGWLVAPALAHDPQKPGFERLAVLTVGLVWQFILVIILLYQETGNLRWSTIRQRLWLNTPRSPQTGEPRGRLWWWLVPLILLTAIYETQISGILDHLWVSLFPFFTEPHGFALMTALDTQEAKAQMVGNWVERAGQHWLSLDVVERRRVKPAVGRLVHSSLVLSIHRVEQVIALP